MLKPLNFMIESIGPHVRKSHCGFYFRHEANVIWYGPYKTLSALSSAVKRSGWAKQAEQLRYKRVMQLEPQFASPVESLDSQG